MKLDEIVLKAGSVVERLKPIAEEVIGLELSKPKIILSKQDSRFAMMYQPNTIIINSNRWNYKRLNSKPKKLSLLELYVAHELGHHIEYTINPYSIEGYSISRALDTIIEGFAEYFCLDLLPKGTLSSDIVSSWRKRWFDVHRNSIYGIGYSFFRAITKKLGKEEAFYVIKNLDVSFKELKNPEIYIKRIQENLERRKIKNA